MTDLSDLSVRALRARRRRLAADLSDVETLLRGRLVRQSRRCGKPGCHCAGGELHGPYTYLSVPGGSGRPRMIYLPADLVDPVTGRLDASGRIDAVLAQIAAINTELLARRERG
jgi:hypothetical protein